MTFAKKGHAECQKVAGTEVNQHSGNTLATHIPHITTGHIYSFIEGAIWLNLKDFLYFLHNTYQYFNKISIHRGSVPDDTAQRGEGRGEGERERQREDLTEWRKSGRRAVLGGDGARGIDGDGTRELDGDGAR